MLARSFDQGGCVMGSRAVILAAAIVIAPPPARGADLVVWWDKPFYPQEEEALREVVSAFEQRSDKQIELVLLGLTEFEDKLPAAIEAGRPPDIAYGINFNSYIAEWAFHDRLVDLTDTVGSFSNLFDPDALAWYGLLNQKTKERALYALPIGRASNHIHIWKSLLERAGFALSDVPNDWEAFWAFWCDQVQPAVRRAMGRDDVWGAGLNMSGKFDSDFQVGQFLAAYGADYVTPDGRLVIDDPEVRRRLIKAIDSYTTIYRKGCIPPDAVNWDGRGNNQAFLAQAVIMTANDTLSIPNALKRDHPEDYYENTATIEWPLGPNGEAFPIEGYFSAAAVFKGGGYTPTAREFVHFLVAEGWLAHYLDFAGERMLPPMPKLRDAPFWLDPSDPHRMAAVMQIASRPMQYDYATVSGDWRYARIGTENVWGDAAHRVVTEGISPEQAVDEAIARIQQILSE
jgi:multiple sugar transport system substrate-binding protein